VGGGDRGLGVLGVYGGGLDGAIGVGGGGLAVLGHGVGIPVACLAWTTHAGHQREDRQGGGELCHCRWLAPSLADPGGVLPSWVIRSRCYAAYL
jgi:hypothetical protein